MSAIYKRTNPTKPARAGDDIRGHLRFDVGIPQKP